MSHVAIPKPLADTLDRLENLEAPRPTVISSYLKLDPESRRRNHYLATLKAKTKELLNSLPGVGLDIREIAKIRADVERLMMAIDEPNELPPDRGMAVFVCGDLDLFEVIPLPRVVRTRIDIDRRPLLHQLLNAQESLAAYLAVVIDRTHCRFFEVTGAGATELPAIKEFARPGGRYVPDRKDSPGTGERDYHQRGEEERNRLNEHVIEQIGELIKAKDYSGIGVLGPVEPTEALMKAFPKEMAERCLGTGTVDLREVSPATVATVIRDIQAAFEANEESQLLDKLDEDFGRGLSVNGAAETLRALELGQIKMLLVPEEATIEGFRGSRTGRLALTQEVLGDEPAIPTPHLVDFVIDDVMRQRGAVRVVNAPGSVARINGLAALLRFGLDVADNIIEGSE